MGNMRLPTVGERGPIDEEKARKIIEYAYSALVTVNLPPSLRPKTSWKYINNTSFRGRKSPALPAIGHHPSTRIRFSCVSRAGSALGSRNGRTSETT